MNGFYKQLTGWPPGAQDTKEINTRVCRKLCPGGRQLLFQVVAQKGIAVRIREIRQKNTPGLGGEGGTGVKVLHTHFYSRCYAKLGKFYIQKTQCFGMIQISRDCIPFIRTVVYMEKWAFAQKGGFPHPRGRLFRADLAGSLCSGAARHKVLFSLI